MAVTTTVPTRSAPTTSADVADDDVVIDVGRRNRDRRTRIAVLFAAVATVAGLATLPATWYSATVDYVTVDGGRGTTSAEIDGFGVWNLDNSGSSWSDTPPVPRHFGILGPTFWAGVMVAAGAVAIRVRRSSIAVIGTIGGWKWGSGALGDLYDAVAGPNAVGDWQITTYAAPNLYGMAFTAAAMCSALAAFGLWSNWREDRAAERAALIASGQPIPPNWLERIATTVIAVMGRIVRNALAEDRRDD